jgi:hypothetical protein
MILGICVLVILEIDWHSQLAPCFCWFLTLLTIWPWRWRWYVPLIHRAVSELHDPAVQKTTVHIHHCGNLKSNIIFWLTSFVLFWILFLSYITPWGVSNVLANNAVTIIRVKSLTIVGESKPILRCGEVNANRAVCDWIVFWVNYPHFIRGGTEVIKHS